MDKSLRLPDLYFRISFALCLNGITLIKQSTILIEQSCFELFPVYLVYLYHHSKSVSHETFAGDMFTDKIIIQCVGGIPFNG